MIDIYRADETLIEYIYTEMHSISVEMRYEIYYTSDIYDRDSRCVIERVVCICDICEYIYMSDI
ncbi:hypothetical protein ACSXEK_17250 (plasmid) [Clostridium perfringens]